MQPFSCPNLIDLHGRRINILVRCKLKVMVEGKVKKETKLRWCQGEVKEVYEDCSKPIVNVLWDAASDIEGCEEDTQSDQILMPSKWNRDVEGAWRMDVDIAVNNVVKETSEDGLEASNSNIRL